MAASSALPRLDNAYAHTRTRACTFACSYACGNAGSQHQHGRSNTPWQVPSNVRQNVPSDACAGLQQAELSRELQALGLVVMGQVLGIYTPYMVMDHMAMGYVVTAYIVIAYNYGLLAWLSWRQVLEFTSSMVFIDLRRTAGTSSMVLTALPRNHW